MKVPDSQVLIRGGTEIDDELKDFEQLAEYDLTAARNIGELISAKLLAAKERTKATERDLEPGEQIAYIPHHASGDIRHPDVELGFVTGSNDKIVFCRYWRKDEPGKLRTVANSEATPPDMLVRYQSVEQSVVTETMERIENA